MNSNTKRQVIKKIYTKKTKKNTKNTKKTTNTKKQVIKRKTIKRVNKKKETKSPVVESLVKIMTPHNEIVELPKQYPGDVWVHQYLIEENHLSLEYYQTHKDTHLKDTYMRYWTIAYGKTKRDLLI